MSFCWMSAPGAEEEEEEEEEEEAAAAAAAAARVMYDCVASGIIRTISLHKFEARI